MMKPCEASEDHGGIMKSDPDDQLMSIKVDVAENGKIPWCGHGTLHSLRSRVDVM